VSDCFSYTTARNRTAFILAGPRRAVHALFIFSIPGVSSPPPIRACEDRNPGMVPGEVHDNTSDGIAAASFVRTSSSPQLELLIEKFVLTCPRQMLGTRAGAILPDDKADHLPQFSAILAICVTGFYAAQTFQKVTGEKVDHLCETSNRWHFVFM
jgi:hypothetical protein